MAQRRRGNGGNGRGWIVFLLVLAVLPLGVADVRDTKHNLAKRPGQKARDVDSKEVCVFCHFPSVNLSEGVHAPAEPPKWQRSIDVNHAYAVYDDIGRMSSDGTMVGSQSVACLACHDSNQAFSVSRLSLDHPFGVPYRGGRVSRQAADAVRAQTKDNPSRAATTEMGNDFRPAYEGEIEGRKVFWASTQVGSYRRGKSDLPLYGRRADEGGEEVPFIECSSCHDPHTTSALFLRVSQDGNRLCLICHHK